MPDLHVLAKDLAASAAKRGFQSTTWENLPGKLMFMVSEMFEALDEALVVEFAMCSVGQNPDRVASYGEELADTAIRILASLGDLYPDMWSTSRITNRTVVGPPLFRSAYKTLFPIGKSLCVALEHWRDDERQDVMIALELALLNTYRAADWHGIDLDKEIALKQARNVLRPPRHGRKQNLG